LVESSRYLGVAEEARPRRGCRVEVRVDGGAIWDATIVNP
jgi:hypothetical protein